MQNLIVKLALVGSVVLNSPYSVFFTSNIGKKSILVKGLGNQLVTNTQRVFYLPNLFHSTSLALLVSSRVSKEAKNFKELEFLGFICCFSVRIEISSKTSKIWPKTIEKRHFLVLFRSLINFSWKTAAQTYKFMFLEVFCFFWHPAWRRECETSGDIEAFVLCLQIWQQWRPLYFFSLFQNKAKRL